MPIILICIVAFISVLCWDWISTNVTVVGTIATSLAFFAMLWSAFEARKSANMAFRAVKTAEASLEEARQNFRKEAFNQRFSLLLEQHNVYLEKINTFVGSDQGWAFVEEIFQTQTHRQAFEKLRGHFICSPYMRVLYHLLKFIHEDYYGDTSDPKGQKKYSSLVRSLISNDVLFLIAVNSSYIHEGEALNQYDAYQKYLQRFDFFEHANFSLLHHPTNTKKSIKDIKNLSMMRSDITKEFESYADSTDSRALDNYRPDISLSVILSYIYKSPSQKETIKWFDEVRDMFTQVVEVIQNRFPSDDELYSKTLTDFPLSHMTENKLPDGYHKELGESKLVNASIINEFFTYCNDECLSELPNPAFFFYRYSEYCKDYEYVGDNNLLIEKINDYLNKIKFKYDFIHGEIYKPSVDNIINKLDEARTRMHEQRHVDG